MKTLPLIIFFILLASYTQGQVCTHPDLSNTLVFKTTLRRLKQPDGTLDSCIIRLAISNKLNQKPIQTISFSSNFLFASAFRQCRAVRSYLTGKNQDAPVVDNDYGDLIVADFNFDGREDVAVKNDSGGNGGPQYSYYLQTSSGKFILNKFLTNEMQFFPCSINKTRRTLTTQVHAGVNGLGETVFRLDGATQQWRVVSRRVLPVNAPQ
ncbi:FG-GAP repeat protein [Hymenobacter saemangeumensis]